MRTLLVFGMLLQCASSFAQQPAEPKSNPEVKRFVYQTNMQVNKRTYDSIYFDLGYDKGKKWVFMYSYKGKEYEMIADDEYFESIMFEIDPPKGTSFTIKASQFEKAKVIYNRGCFCADAGLRQLYDGSITGKKINNTTWLVTYNLQIEPRPGREGLSVNKKLKGYFKPGKIIY